MQIYTIVVSFPDHDDTINTAETHKLCVYLSSFISYWSQSKGLYRKFVSGAVIFLQLNTVLWKKRILYNLQVRDTFHWFNTNCHKNRATFRWTQKQCYCFYRKYRQCFIRRIIISYYIIFTFLNRSNKKKGGFSILVKKLRRLVFSHWSHLFTNTFTTMHVKIRRNTRWRASIVDSLTDHFTWQMLSYSHMHLVQMFQLKVHTSSMTGWLPQWNFYKYNTWDM